MNKRLSFATLALFCMVFLISPIVTDASLRCSCGTHEETERRCFLICWDATITVCNSPCYRCDTTSYTCEQNDQIGDYSTLNDCKNSCKPVSANKYKCVQEKDKFGNITSWECKININGQYTSESLCNSYCKPNSSLTRYSCDTNYWFMFKGLRCNEDPNGAYSSLDACNQALQSGACFGFYECNTDTWQCFKSNKGTFSSLKNCQDSCKPCPLCRYKCIPGLFICETNYDGVFTSLENCESNCSPDTSSSSSNRYRCDLNLGKCVLDVNGVFTSEESCIKGCNLSIEPSRYSCDPDKWECYKSYNGTYSSLGSCEDVCNEGSATCLGDVKPTTTISCPGDSNCYKCNSSYECVKSSAGPYTSKSSCLNACKKPSPPPVSPPPVSPPPVSPPPVSPPPVSPPLSQCRIFEFSINGKTNEDRDPLLVWVNALLKGYVSVDDSCTKCTVTSNDTWGNPPKDYTITPLSTYINEEFRIPESGTYSFSVKCIGDPANPNDFDEDTVSLKTVQAINLPWWREIIPVLPKDLQGFLRGIF